MVPDDAELQSVVLCWIFKRTETARFINVFGRTADAGRQHSAAKGSQKLLLVKFVVGLTSIHIVHVELPHITVLTDKISRKD